MGKKLHIKKDDVVQVISGKEKGKKGKVLAIFKETNRATVEKLNMFKRHTKPSQGNQQGGIIEREGSIHISNILPVDDKLGKGVRVKWKKLEDGNRVRVSVKTGEIIDKT